MEGGRLRARILSRRDDSRLEASESGTAVTRLLWRKGLSAASGYQRNDQRVFCSYGDRGLSYGSRRVGPRGKFPKCPSFCRGKGKSVRHGAGSAAGANLRESGGGACGGG